MFAHFSKAQTSTGYIHQSVVEYIPVSVHVVLAITCGSPCLIGMATKRERHIGVLRTPAARLLMKVMLTDVLLLLPPDTTMHA